MFRLKGYKNNFKNTFRFLIACALVSESIIPQFVSPNIAAAEVVEAATLEFTLNQLQARLDALLNDARNKGIDLTLVVGSQLSSQITLARELFHTELDYQRLQWDEKISQQVNNLNKAVTALEENAYGKAQDLLNQAQLVTLSLPFSNSTPHIRAISPIVTFRPPVGVDDLVFNVAGVFPDFGLGDEYTPILTLQENGANGQPLPPFPASSGTAFAVQFHIPHKLLAFPNSALHTIRAKIDITYKDSCLLIFPCDSKVSIPVLIGLLPPSPGNLHISFSNTTLGYVTQTRTSYSMHQDASAGDDMDHPQTFNADPNYEILTDSVQIHVDSADGDWGLNGNCSTSTTACWRIKTVQHHCVAFVCPQGHDGSVNFHLSFVERKLTPQTQSGSIDIPVSWNQTSLHTFPSLDGLSWDAVYTDFNNRSWPFGSRDTNVKSPYMKVSAVTGQTIAFSLYPFTIDAGSGMTVVPPTAYAATDPVSILVAKIPGISLNPLTREGFSTLKAFAVKALSSSATPITENSSDVPPVKITQLANGMRAVTLAVTVGDSGAPAANSLTPSQRALNEAITALSNVASDESVSLK